MIKRIKILFIFIFLVLLFLIYRLYDLQILDHEEMLKRVSNQRLISVPVNILRGTIYDRNLIPLTDNEEETVVAVIPQLIEDEDYVAKLISTFCETDYKIIYNKITQNTSFECRINEENIEQLKVKLVPGIIISQTTLRHGETSIARHVIGYTNSDYVGQSGIEKGYNEILLTDNRQRVGIISDGLQRPLIGYGYRAVQRSNSNNAQNVKLTLDCHFQRIIEEQFDKYSYNGAAVLLDSQSGDILAMVSRPDFDQNDIAKYFNSDKKELINKALYPYNLGSIFKIVVAEATLEEGYAHKNTQFYCPGYKNINGQIVRCSSYYSGGHGDIDFEEAFAKSCNTAFIELGLKLGHKKIIETAQKFGLGQVIGLTKYGLIEEKGLVEDKKYVSNREIANVSIGQGEILVTPIQVANMINIISNDGIQREINIVDSIIDNNNIVIKSIKNSSEKRIISKESARLIKNMMSAVTEIGTGQKADIYQYGGIAGKTSSAETGIFNEKGQVINAWFGGFFPKDDPRYTLVIIIEDGKSSTETAVPLFTEMAREILKLQG